TEFAKLESGLIVPETRASNHTQTYIGVARCVAVAVLQAKADHSTHHESKQSSIGKQRWGHDLSKNIEHIEHVRAGHHGQVNELLNLYVSQQGPDMVVFSQYFLFGWVRGPIRAAAFPVFKKDLHSAIEPI